MSWSLILLAHLPGSSVLRPLSLSTTFYPHIRPAQPVRRPSCPHTAIQGPLLAPGHLTWSAHSLPGLTRGPDLTRPDRPASTTHMALTAHNAQIEVRIPLPQTLHHQLRQRALNEGLTIKAAVVAAVEAWVAPAKRHASTEAPGPDLAQVRAQVVAVVTEHQGSRSDLLAKLQALAE